MKTSNELQHDVLEELEWDPSVNAADIGVSVSDGIVRLTGDVPNYGEKWRAEAAIKRVAGVKGVVNNLKVRLPDSNVRTDAAIAHAVVNALEWDIEVPHDTITPTITNGIVKLEGTVIKLYQKEAAERAVRHLTGVTSVLNLIKVQPQVRVVDVQDRIEQAFKRRAAFDAAKVRVVSTDGTVQLYGKVDSWAEHDEAEQAARSAPGVVSIENHILVS